MDIDKKTRYLLFNQDRKILVLDDDISHQNGKMYLPGNFTNLTGSLEFKQKMEEISDSLVYIHSLNYKIKCLQEINGKLKPKNIEIVKEFYAYYVDNEEFFYEVYAFFKKYNFECYFLTINEILALNDFKIYLDKGMKEATTILSKKLDYQLY